MKTNSLKRNVIMNIILTTSNFIFPLITFPYISRILTPVGTGKVSFATSLISYFSMIAQLGIPTYGIRACSKVRDDKDKLSKTVQEILLINIIMNIISYATLFIAIFAVPKLRTEKDLYLIVSITIFLTSLGVEWLYKALEKYTYIAIRSIIFKFVALICMFLFIHTEKDYVIYGGISILASSASYILNFINIRKYINFKKYKDYNIKRHFKPVLVFFLMSCATVIYTNLDTVMLGFMKSNADVGYYNAATKIKHILISIVTSLGAVLLPRLSYYVKQKRFDDFNKICIKAINFIFITSIPLCAYFMIFAKEGIMFLSGAEYAGAILPMIVIMPTLVLVGLSNISGIQMLVPLGKEKEVLVSEILGAITDILLNIIFIPKFGAAGAAFATVIAEIVVLLTQIYYINKYIKIEYDKIKIGHIIISTIISTFVIIPLKFLEFNAFATLLLSSCLYFGLYIILLLYAKDPIVIGIKDDISNRLKRVLKGKK